MNFKPPPSTIKKKNNRKLLVLGLLRGGTEVKHWFETSQKFKEKYYFIYIH